MSDSTLNRRSVLAGMAAGAAALALPRLARAGDPDVLHFANPFAEGTPMGTALGRWKKAVQERNGGKFKVKLSHGDDVGGQAQVIDGVRKGKFAGALVTTHGLRDAVPRLQVLDLPFLFRDATDAEVDKALKAAKDDVKAALEANNLHLIWLFNMGHQVLLSTQGEPLVSPESLKDVKIGTRMNSLDDDLWRAVGGQAVNGQIPDIKYNLNSGKVGAADLSYFEIEKYDFSGKGRSITLTHHAVNVGFLLMNKELFDSMKDKNAEALVSDRAAQQDQISNHISKRQEALKDDFKSKGFKVHYVTTQQRKALLDIAWKGHAAWLADRAPAKKIYDAVISAK